MVSVRAMAAAHVALLALCGGLLAAPSAHAQDAPDQAPQEPVLDDLPPIDVDSPLDALPGLAVEWPELDDDDGSEEAAEGVTQVSDELRYLVAIEGMPDVGGDDIRSAFAAQSALEAGDGEAVNAVQVDVRARSDSELLTTILRSKGYYAARVIPDIQPQGEGGVRVTMLAEPGPLYRFQSVELPGLDAAGEVADELRRAFGVQAGDPVDAALVIAAGQALDVALGEEGFASAQIGEQQVIVDHEAASASLTLTVDTGPPAVFGDIRVIGEPPFPATHVDHIARFEAGDPYQRSLVQDLRRALVATGLISAVSIDVQPRDDANIVDLAVNLQPAPPRTVAGALGYNSGEGFRVEASWEHRNLFNPEGAFTARAVAGTQEQLGAVGLRFNNWRRRDQALSFSALAGSIDRPAYRADLVTLTTGIERTSNFIWQKAWTYSVGLELIASDEENDIIFFEGINETNPEIITLSETFFIGALPVSLDYDGSDDLLDPTTGFRLGGWLSPEISLDGSTNGYARMQVDASAYFPVSPSVVLAGRVRVGAIFGADIDNIAPSRRFYAGGGGSVRGYEFQAIGPIEEFLQRPTGGRSLTELAFEVRYRLNEQWGVVPFIDAGRVSEDPWPGQRDFRIGAGSGVRYYSNFGPIRIDLGTPLNPRDGDARIAVAVSLGQAF